MTVLLLSAPVLVASVALHAQDGRLGVVASADLANDPAAQEALFTMGIQWVRVARSWDQLEPSKGRYDWAATDNLIEALTARGLNVYWDFSYAPRWANGNRANNHPPKDQKDLQAFVYAVVRRYGYERKQIKHWGNWNETNLSQFYEGGVSRFASHELRTTLEAIRAADPEAHIAVGELSSSGGPKRVAGQLKKILEAAGPAASAVSQHLYDGDETCAGRLRLLDQLHAELAAAKHADLPIWVTETGLARPEDEKSQYLTCLTEGMSSRPWWPKTFWYRLEYERPPKSPYSFGLLEPGLDPAAREPTSTYWTLRKLARPPAP